MDIASMGFALDALSSYNTASASPNSLAFAVSTKILDQSLDLNQEMGAAMVQMMEHSVNPHLGNTIDLYA